MDKNRYETLISEATNASGYNFSDTNPSMYKAWCELGWSKPEEAYRMYKEACELDDKKFTRSMSLAERGIE